ncbi:RNA-binding protein 28-like, partial [Notothenia coriiceps]|uniref:RNA-binding protein 28-like n=1 Tax=Notothenia coriiceps TaxID=8208 RepID=A0A6I9MFD2_9TELE
MRGFAFVQFKNVSEAAKALTAMNLKEIKGRQVAIDWAVPKDKFIATQSSASAGAKVTEATAKPSASKSDSEDEEEEKPQAAPAKKKVTTKPEVEESQSGDEDDSEEQDSEEEEEEEAADDEKEDDDVSQEGDDDDDEDKSNLDSEEDQDESEGDEDDEDDEDEESAKKKKVKKLLPSDVPEGKTIFLRNLSFDTEEEDLEEILLKYGELNYIKVVLHPDTGHSKGCAFAQFKNKEAADKCLAASQDEAESAGIRLDGRKLMIVAAVTREDASKLKVDKVKVETGTRNLYLAREG